MNAHEMKMGDSLKIKDSHKLKFMLFLLNMRKYQITMDTYFRYSDGGTSFLNKETMTIVEVRLSRTELRKKVTKPI